MFESFEHVGGDDLEKKGDYRKISTQEFKKEGLEQPRKNTISTNGKDSMESDNLIRSMPSNHYFRIPGILVIPKGRGLMHSLGIICTAAVLGYLASFFYCKDSYFGWYVFNLAKLTILFGILVSLSDPGYFQRAYMEKHIFDQKKSEGKIYCKHCLTLKNDQVDHCSLCECCVKKRHHHCDMFGNCIGRRNIVCFYIAAIAGASGLATIMIGVNDYISKCAFQLV